MSIWNGEITLEMINDLNKNTLGECLEMEFIEIGSDYMVATMPVNNKTKQPFGLLHGGASVALAETIGSVASWCVVNREHFIGVGIEINSSHIKAVTSGEVRAVCKAIKVGGKTHIWEIKMFNTEKQLCCLTRFTCMIVPRPRQN